jgi:hypothetical protein
MIQAPGLNSINILRMLQNKLVHFENTFMWCIQMDGRYSLFW